MPTAAPIVTDLFHAVIAACRRTRSLLPPLPRNSARRQQLSAYDAVCAAYNAQQDALALAQLQGSNRQPEPEPEPEMEPELAPGVVASQTALIEGDDDQANVEAMFGQLYGAGLLGGPLEQHKEEAHRNGVLLRPSEPTARQGRPLPRSAGARSGPGAILGAARAAPPTPLTTTSCFQSPVRARRQPAASPAP